MNLQTHQRGFVGMISLLIGLSFLSLLLLEIATSKTREQKISQAAPFYDRMKHTVQQINAYQMDQVAGGRWTINELGIFPNNWRELEPTYLPHCNSSEENKGYCIPHSKTPWNTLMTMHKDFTLGTNSAPQLTITIPMQPNNTTFALERDAYIGPR